MARKKGWAGISAWGIGARMEDVFFLVGGDSGAVYDSLVDWRVHVIYSRLRSFVRKGVARSHEHPPCFCHCQAIQIRYRLHAALMLYQCVWAPFRNLTFSSRSGSESIYLLKSSTVISCSQISRTASCSSSKVHPPYGFLFRSLYFKILHTFSIGFKSGE